MSATAATIGGSKKRCEHVSEEQSHKNDRDRTDDDVAGEVRILVVEVPHGVGHGKRHRHDVASKKHEYRDERANVTCDIKREPDIT